LSANHVLGSQGQLLDRPAIMVEIPEVSGNLGISDSALPFTVQTVM
jgi:hypothetical protein